MKKSIVLIILFLISTAAINGKKITTLIFETPQVKTVKFSVFTGSDYSGRLYKNSKAKVILSIYKFRDNQSELLWKGEIDQGNIRNYPTACDPLFRKISIYNVFESRETVCASYKVIYNTKGSKMSYENGIVLSSDTLRNTLPIAI